MKRAALILLLSLLVLALNAQAGQFKHVVYYPAGQRPYAVVATQLTSSGNLDLVVANYATSQVFVLLGTGDGTFQQPIKLSIPSPVALAVGDFNGDGKEDLAVAEYGGTGKSSVAILLGDGTGNFRFSGSYSSGVETTGVVVADFNGDNHDDVAVANNIGTVKVLFGTGKGALGKPTTYKLPGTNPIRLAAGDLNGDGHPGLAVAEAIGGSVAVLLNDGTGKFLKPITYKAGGGQVLDVKIADLRHNGKQDLIIGNGSLSAIGVLLNKGEGTFGPVKLYSTLCDVEAVVVADFNLDGHLDVAVAAQIGNSALLYGNGKGSFGGPVPIHDEISTDGGFSIAAGDFNNDQAPDLAIPIELKGKVAILLNTK